MATNKDKNFVIHAVFGTFVALVSVGSLGGIYSILPIGKAAGLSIMYLGVLAILGAAGYVITYLLVQWLGSRRNTEEVEPESSSGL